MRTRRLGADGPLVTSVAVGTSPLGGSPMIYGYDVPEDRAIATVRAALDSPIRFLDTANEYGDGASERRIAAAIREAGGAPRDLVIATKADPIRGVRDFSGERVRRSFQESCERLGVDRFDVFFLHDPERFDVEYITQPGGALDAMTELKAEGSVGTIGVAGGDLEQMRRYVDTGRFDVLLNHSRYTLLDRSADALIDHALDAGLAFVNAAPYASGMLAKPASSSPRYQYGAPPDTIVETTEWLRTVCAEFDVPLAALALQFSSRDPRITSTVVGVSDPSRVDALVRNEAIDIPEDLWHAVAERLDLARRPDLDAPTDLDGDPS